MGLYDELIRAGVFAPELVAYQDIIPHLLTKKQREDIQMEILESTLPDDGYGRDQRVYDLMNKGRTGGQDPLRFAKKDPTTADVQEFFDLYIEGIKCLNDILDMNIFSCGLSVLHRGANKPDPPESCLMQHWATVGGMQIRFRKAYDDVSDYQHFGLRPNDPVRKSTVVMWTGWIQSELLFAYRVRFEFPERPPHKLVWERDTNEIYESKQALWAAQDAITASAKHLPAIAAALE